MDHLPPEIIESILTNPNLTTKDVVSVSATCHYLRNIVLNSNAIWKNKYFQERPILISLLDSNKKQEINYLEELKYIYDAKYRARALLEQLPLKFYKKYEISDSDLDDWIDLMNEKEETYYYLVIDLMEIVNTHTQIKTMDVIPLMTPGNRTLQYYSNKVLRFIRQYYLSKVWHKFVSLPPEQQILEKGAVFVSQWCQPHVEVSYDEIAKKLDHIAEKVRIKLSQTCPEHPLFKVPRDVLLMWRNNRIPKNQFDVVECRELLSAVRHVMFNQIGFSGNNHAYYMPQNSFIDEVLEKKHGLPITLAIIFEGVARRVGLRCDPISFPAHFLLRFTESSEPDSDWYYIDVFYGGQLVKKGACPHSKYSTQKDLFPVATAAQVVERMANNLEVSARQHTQPNGRINRLRSSLELLKLVNPKDISALVSLARLYMLHNMDTKGLEQFLLSQEFEVPEQAQRVVHMLRDYEAHHSKSDFELMGTIEAAQRTNNLKYAVGMVMTHLALNYKCVIYDWDPVCLAASEWQVQNNVSKLTLKDDQPFYNVLVEDGSHRYVAQENLKPTRETGFLYLNDDIGRHFSHFYESFYIPNAEKEKEYPADKKTREMFYEALKNERGAYI